MAQVGIELAYGQALTQRKGLMGCSPRHIKIKNTPTQYSDAMITGFYVIYTNRN